MTLVLDAAPLVALADRADPRRDEIASALDGERGKLVIPAPVTAEVDYMLGRFFGRPARRAFLADLAAGRYEVVSLDAADHATVIELESRYEDLDLGLADCSLVVVADRRGTERILSFDERDLRAVTPLAGGAFRLLPADGEAGGAGERVASVA